MNRSLSPSLLLEAPTVSVRRQTRRSNVHWFDYAFFTLILIMICGGALFMLELGSTQSAGHESTLGQLMSEGSIWIAVAVKKISYYGLLFLASVVNSALMVAFVQIVRSLDRRFSRSVQRRWPSSSHKVRQTRPASTQAVIVARAPATMVVPASAKSLPRSFLLNPLMR
jgi:hypothetical protein